MWLETARNFDKINTNSSFSFFQKSWIFLIHCPRTRFHRHEANIKCASPIQKELQVLKHQWRKRLFAQAVVCLLVRSSFSPPLATTCFIIPFSPVVGIRGRNQPFWNPSMGIISILWGNKRTHLWRWWWGGDRSGGGGRGHPLRDQRD